VCDEVFGTGGDADLGGPSCTDCEDGVEILEENV